MRAVVLRRVDDRHRCPRAPRQFVCRPAPQRHGGGLVSFADVIGHCMQNNGGRGLTGRNGDLGRRDIERVISGALRVTTHGKRDRDRL